MAQCTQTIKGQEISLTFITFAGTEYGAAQMNEQLKERDAENEKGETAFWNPVDGWGIIMDATADTQQLLHDSGAGTKIFHEGDTE